MRKERQRFLPVALGGYRVVAQFLGIGAGGELRAPLGIAVVGGMFFSTMFTIFIVPATYLVVEGMRERVAKRRADREAARESGPAGAPAA